MRASRITDVRSWIRRIAVAAVVCMLAADASHAVILEATETAEAPTPAAALDRIDPVEAVSRSAVVGHSTPLTSGESTETAGSNLPIEHPLLGFDAGADSLRAGPTPLNRDRTDRPVRASSSPSFAPAGQRGVERSFTEPPPVAAGVRYVHRATVADESPLPWLVTAIVAVALAVVTGQYLRARSQRARARRTGRGRARTPSGRSRSRRSRHRRSAA